MPTIRISTATAAALCALFVSAQASAQMRGAPPAPATPAPGPMGVQTPAPGPTDTQPPPSAPASKADTGAAANTNATAPTQPLAAGLTVKDNTGAAIGQITEVKTDAAGRSMATIKMGADSFQAPAANLAVQDGAAVINLTQAQIASQLHKPKS